MRPSPLPIGRRTPSHFGEGPQIAQSPSLERPTAAASAGKDAAAIQALAGFGPLNIKCEDPPIIALADLDKGSRFRGPIEEITAYESPLRDAYGNLVMAVALQRVARGKGRGEFVFFAPNDTGCGPITKHCD
jgi:hypothetical protein